MNLPNDRMIKEPSADFLHFVDLLIKDVIKIAEQQHNVGAFTAVNYVLSQCYRTMTGVDPFNLIMPVGPDKILEWAKDVTTGRKRKYFREISEDLIQIIQLTAKNLDVAVHQDGASFGYVLGLLVALSRAYYVVNKVDILPNVATNMDETTKKLIDWAWSFRISERLTPIKDIV